MVRISVTIGHELGNQYLLALTSYNKNNNMGSGLGLRRGLLLVLKEGQEDLSSGISTLSIFHLFSKVYASPQGFRKELGG